MTNQNLDRNFKRWLLKYAHLWKTSLDQIPFVIGQNEITNRWAYYPLVRVALDVSPFDITEFENRAKHCWVLGNRFDGIRFARFVRNGDAAGKAVKELITNFPKSDSLAVKRINTFVDRVVNLGISDEKGVPDRAGAAQLASLILTVKYPKRFVDFRKGRWIKFAKNLGYDLPEIDSSYGQWLIWAGEFARLISRTRVYEQLWFRNNCQFPEPNWVLAGICWREPPPKKPNYVSWDHEKESFPEGKKKEKLHIMHERNKAVVSIAKALAFMRDPLLRCQVCGFSFAEKYGSRGGKFIEAHHLIPLARLQRARETKIADIALVCANCHRMLHNGNGSLTLEQLRALLTTS